MTPEEYLDLKQFVINQGYSHDIDFYDVEKADIDEEVFVLEAIWAICNSGMKNQIAEKIYKKILQSIIDGKPIAEAFGHKGKVKAIQYIIDNKQKLYRGYLSVWTLEAHYRSSVDTRLDYLETLPWIGPITKYHLAKNLGIDCVKPDRHLERIAKEYDTNPHDLCKNISDIIGDKLSVVDYVIWRAANLGKI